MLMSRTWTQQIVGCDIRIYDGLLSAQDVHALTLLLESGGFVRSEITRPETAAYRHRALNIPLETATRLPIYAPALEAATEFHEGRPHRLYRCYCNYAAYGDMLFTHTDCPPEEIHLTALWYIAPEWNMEWGGETIFFNSQQDAEAVVSPRPGRLVMFDGRLMHVGRPSNRICFAPRYTLAMKIDLAPSKAQAGSL